MSDTTRIWYHTFGCKANQYDTERMRQELEARGAMSVPTPSQADVVVINTCTVTNQADANARHLIRRLRRQRPALKIVVAGCSAALKSDEYRAMPETDEVVAGQDPVVVAEAMAPFGLIEDPVAQAGPLRRNARGTRAWLKVQDGCDRQCSFCATRVARGVSRSRPPEEVVEEARALSRVHPELVITGIHIGHYGLDLEPSVTLTDLLERLLSTVTARIRLSSIEATEIDDRMVRLVLESGGQLAPHLHVPLQSGSDHVLATMRRWHTREAVRSRLLDIASRIAPLGLGADVIVGFPGETDADHAETRALIEELPYTYLHVFPYSVRDKTVAASLPDRVPGDVAARRSRELREIVLEKGRVHRRCRVGQRADVVVEGAGRSEHAGGFAAAPALGLTGDYLRVEIVGAARPGDRFVTRLCAEGERLLVSTRESHEDWRAIRRRRRSSPDP